MWNKMNSQEKDLEEPGHSKNKVKIKTKMRIMKKINYYLLCYWIFCMKEQYLNLRNEYVLEITKLMSEWRFMYLLQYSTLGAGNVERLLARLLFLLSRYHFDYYSVALHDHISLHNLDLMYASASILNTPYGHLHERLGNQKYKMINHVFCYLLSRWKELWNKRHFVMVSVSFTVLCLVVLY